jgi:mono/diheme cytochrome c family protein
MLALIRRYSSLVVCLAVATAAAQTDPGPRPGASGAGGPLPGLSAADVAFFNAARDIFTEVDSVKGGVSGEPGVGLGPTFNGNSCAACHAQPAVGGSSPHPTLGQVMTPNPQVGFASLDRLPGQNQTVPSFITSTGPVREARFIKNPDGTSDGSVHDLYTIAGRVDAHDSTHTCGLAQTDFATQLANHNVIFRIPTPTFGAGLIENLTDSALQTSFHSTKDQRKALGIAGRFNTSANDGTITRFGWKAQNKSLLIFAGEAYNVEQGVSNENFPNERELTSDCDFNTAPEDTSHTTNPVTGGTTGTLSQMSSDIVNFAGFMRFLAPPAPAPTSTATGKALFEAIGCNACHTETFTTGPSSFQGQSGVTFSPYSDIAIHHMGPGLADHVTQGIAGPDEFRTAPLWGAGQRIFFLHDGRATPDNGGLIFAIEQHASVSTTCTAGQTFDAEGIACGSEANAVIANYNGLAPSDQQAILDFLRSL